MPKNNLYVIIHGHFYQPPREDPWTGEIERQPSAYPYHDWNERINKECYAANAASRVLDSAGRIENIINNYEKISFNFGPTLMSWIKDKDKPTYQAIVAADKASIKQNNGHGNAIAQVYNHIILPLANERDIITEIEWGIKSFENDFGREPEGIWLAETAVNDRVAEYLISYGIKFIILSPTQAKAVRPVNAADHNVWKDVSNNTIDPSKPYLLKEKNGTIAVYFYSGDIATKLSFEHLLRNVSFLRGEILHHNNPEKDNFMINVATDGETYGHHEPFGDMCLARLIHENNELKDFTFTNYARYLEINPPQDYVHLKEGNENLGTAWSCSHGVDRWRKDCGCSTGGQVGWNQKWREGLRNAFDFLRDQLHLLADKELVHLLKEPWKARNEYIQILQNGDISQRPELFRQFIKKHGVDGLSEAQYPLVSRWLEALHNGLLMYTSCGWFFSEISGIETLQDLKYASRIFDLVGSLLPNDTKDKFLEKLQFAKSNISDYHNGKWIFENLIEKNTYTENHIVNEFLLSELLLKNLAFVHTKAYYYYYGVTVSDYQDYQKENWQIYKFKLNLENHSVLENSRYISYIFRDQEYFKIFIRKYYDDSLLAYLDKILEKDDLKQIMMDFDDWFNRSFTMHDLQYDTKENLLMILFENTMRSLHYKFNLDQMHLEDYLSAIRLYQELGVNMQEKDLVAMKELLNSYILGELEQLETMDIDQYDFTRLITIFKTAKKAELHIDYIEFIPYIRKYILKRLDHAVNGLDHADLSNIQKLIEFTNVSGIDFEKYEIQNTLFIKLNEILKDDYYLSMNVNILHQLLKIADYFNISIVPFEKMTR